MYTIKELEERLISYTNAVQAEKLLKVRNQDFGISWPEECVKIIETALHYAKINNNSSDFSE